ncbi:hypothetical protein CgunFtcFv8_009631 [Champsocephalus gunnari]|uniref:Uncharacterized protein n=1 Tax=Champsocephalus gunnari TaxID=52237 RepID=A0AAN8C2J6_CHAGU|nr:hypothetical protein CgunFtcFv8_009631 [Champsocephalus gunnari]
MSWSGRDHPALRAALCSTACPFCHPGTRLTAPATCPPHPDDQEREPPSHPDAHPYPFSAAPEQASSSG